MAVDASWWDSHNPEGFTGSRWCHTPYPGTHRFLPLAFVNSGAAALELARQAECKRAVLLGYDMGYAQDGKRHWHADHTGPGGNAGGIDKWPALFNRTVPRLRGMEVLNASRVSALTQFKRVDLHEALRIAV